MLGVIKMTGFIKRYYAEIIGGIVCLTLGMLSGYSVKAGGVWYAHLIKPSFTPPDWLFGPVWSVLYLMMGIALGKIWQLKANNTLLLWLFSVQFGLNLLWTPLFFYFHRIDLALYDILLLALSLIALMAVAWRERVIFRLCIPYVLWVGFAVILNFSLYQLNRL
jgi:tryptophan-rich sensory protein